MVRLGRRVVAWGLAALVGVAAAGCGGPTAAQQPLTGVTADLPASVPAAVLGASPTTTSSAAASASAGPGQCPFPQSGFDCDFQRRFAAVQSYIAGRPGTVGIVVRDRQT